MASALLTKEELLFLKKAEGLSLWFDKIAQAKRLIAEAQVEMRSVLKSFGKKSPKTVANKVLRAPKPKPVEFGVDLPTELTKNEATVLAELKKGPKKPRELVAATKLSASVVAYATRGLAKRKLVTATGKTLDRVWKVK